MERLEEPAREEEQRGFGMMYVEDRSAG